MKKQIGIFVGLSLLVAGVVHVAFVWALPSLIMRVAFYRLGKRAPDGRALYAPPISARSRDVVMPSPDLLYTICVFDLAKGPMKIRAFVPKSYWSVAFYDDETNAFFAINDRRAGPGPRQWRLIGPNAPAPKHKSTVQAPSSRGLILFRLLIEDRKQLAALQKLQRQATCTQEAR